MDISAQVVDNSEIKKLSESVNKSVTSNHSLLSADQFRHLWKLSDN
jgi:hypothetical protein